ncbi:uncharacterized protein LOC123523227 [Mercenaria mercenaria]|uniref:uncharacterized protein LOC123523227 n=1 Tax=Mercenaria mercenaria TaxID=6596 RepID=UPI001E1D9602|nr:uncharacterized protein LOC123523227 [Mercenaria mercenaria]
MKTIPNISNYYSLIFVCVVMMTVHRIEAHLTERVDRFYDYVLNKGIPIQHIYGKVYRVSYLKWSCIIDTSIAKKFRKANISWKDMFETDIDVLSKKTVLSPDILRKKIGTLPEDGTPVTLVARQGNVSIPKENVIIRLNNHGTLDARTTMVMTWPNHVKTIAMSAQKQPTNEIINWTHYNAAGKKMDYGLWNTSQPLVIPQKIWGFKKLIYYRGPFFFMKGSYIFGQLANCTPKDGIGLGALNRVVDLKGYISTLGFSTGLDKYNTKFFNRFTLLAHKLAWSYYVVPELTDTGVFFQDIVNLSQSHKVWNFSGILPKFESVFVYLNLMIVVMFILKWAVRCRKRARTNNLLLK